MISIESPKLIATLADDVRDGSLIVDIGAYDLSMVFALGRPVHALAVLPDATAREVLLKWAEDAGISDRVQIARNIATQSVARPAFICPSADAYEDTLILDAFGVDHPVSLIRIAAPAAVPEFAQALSSTLLQRDAPVICMDGLESALDALAHRLVRFGYRRAESVDGYAIFRQSSPASSLSRNATLDYDALAESVALRLLPRVASLIEDREATALQSQRPLLAKTVGAEFIDASPTPTIHTIEGPRRTGMSAASLRAPKVAAAGGALNHIQMTADQIAQWRANAKVERVTDEGVIFVAAGPLHLSSPSFAVEPDAFYSLAIRARLATGEGLIRVLVMDDAVDIPVLCRDRRANGSDEVLIRAEFRSLHRSTTLRIRIEAPETKAGQRLAISQAQISHVGSTKQLAKWEAALGLALPVASMATVTGREEMLLDAVSGLYRQCSKIQIFLNGHTNLPSYLDDPRIEVAWSSDHGDMGDTGKFFWAESQAKGPRLVVDDDFLFPTNFADHMIAKLRRYGRRAIIGIHGIVLRQPLLKSYYDAESRHVRRYVIGLGADMPVHAVGTGAVCYDPEQLKLTLKDFRFNNMADVWVMLAAQRQHIPIIAAARPHQWLIDNRTTQASDSIWKASSSGANSHFNTATIQSHVARGAWPITLQRRASAGVATSKALLLVEALQGADPAIAAIEAWQATRPRNYDWVLVIAAPDQQTESALQDWLAKADIQWESHLIGPVALKRPVTASDLIETLRLIDHDVGVRFAPGVRAKDKSWSAILGEARTGDWVEICRDGPNSEPLALAWAHAALVECLPQVARVEQASPTRTGGDWIQACLSVAEAQQRRRLSSLRAAQALAFADDGRPADALSGPLHASEPVGRLRRDRRSLWRHCKGAIALNDVAERVFLLNLDRRPDRLAAFTAQAKSIGLEFERISALDGSLEPQISEWRAYIKQPLTPFPKGTRAFTWEWDLYHNYVSDNHRVAHYEHKLARKAMSKGAWGYQKSMIEILRRAIDEDWESVLIFDDDCRFHRDLVRLFDRRMREAPPDWIMLSLGALQYSWDRKWVEWRTEGLYSCMGSSVGSHALLLHREAYPAILSRALRMALPFDIGALHSVKRTFAKQCFVFSPNLFIQDVGDSDIGDSESQLREGIKTENAYRWNLPDYFMPRELTPLSQIPQLEPT